LPTIQLSRVERDYLAAFDITAVCVSHTGKVHVTRSPRDGDITHVWWCKAEHAAAVANAAQLNGDVLGAALRLQVQLTEHAKLIARVRERTAKIDAALKQALDEGTLKVFNTEYRKRRLAAQAAGRPFMTYGTAHARLRKAITCMLAKGGLVTGSLIVSVFDTK
jgi:hypothetical protein